MDRARQQLASHVLWIGGAPDTGKSTVAQILAERHELQVYHYDRHDARHHQRLAETIPRYRAFLSASLDERWVRPKPEALLQRSLQSFRDRFPLVIEDLLALPGEPLILAEGFGLTPELVFPILAGNHQAIWLVPTEQFKRASMQRRDKPSFRHETSDPDLARQNLFRRDLLLAEYVRKQAPAFGLTVHEVDSTRSVEQVAALVEQHFAAHLRARRR